MNSTYHGPRSALFAYGTLRAPDPQEDDMSDSDVTAAIASLEGALARLRQGPAAASEEPSRDGRYEGGNTQLFVELRVDAAGAGVLSGDVSRTSNEGPQYVASFRTAPGTPYTGAPQAWPTFWESAQGEVGTGSVTLAGAPADPDGAFATLRLDSRLNGLPPNVDLVVAARSRPSRACSCRAPCRPAGSR
jgi:hypothetical protein